MKPFAITHIVSQSKMWNQDTRIVNRLAIRRSLSAALLVMILPLSHALSAAVIGDRVWNDSNQNGIQNAGEAGIQGITVTLESYTGPSSPTPADYSNPANWSVNNNPFTVTNASGNYNFQDVAVGTYRLQFSLAATYVFTSSNQTNPAQDSDVNAAGYSGPIVIDNPGLINNTVDAGMYVDPTLPVTLVSFHVASDEGSTATIRWTTTLEVNSNYFIVQQSIDAHAWNDIARIPASKNNNDLKVYRYKDRQPAKGINYYRLKMVDLDDSFAYSNTRVFTAKTDQSGPDLTAYPNPATTKLYIQYNGGSQIAELRLLDLTGKVITVASSSQLKSGVNLQNISNGTYLLDASLTNGRKESTKVIIAR